MLEKTFINLLTSYTNDKRLAIELWHEVEDNYSDKKRHYHTLLHLENLLNQLTEVKDKIVNWETVLFTLYYHDIVYNALQSDNEEKSAELAEKRMKQISVPDNNIDNCKVQILATKKHLESFVLDTNYFIDADLSILGLSEDVYTDYSKKVRLEYLYYPSVIYIKGRIQVLKHFLNQDSLYKTQYFKNKFEEQARININKEISTLEKIKDEFFLTDSNQWCFIIENDGNWSEFFHNGVELLKNTNGVEISEYYPGFFGSGYCRFNYKNVKLNLEYEGMLGIDLRTEPNPAENDLYIAKEIYEILKQVRNNNYA